MTLGGYRMKNTPRLLSIMLASTLATATLIAVATSGAAAQINVTASFWFTGTYPQTASAPPMLVPSQQYQNQPSCSNCNSDEKDTLRRWPAFGYALFAADDIEIRGNNVRINGVMKANDDIDIKGKWASYQGRYDSHDKQKNNKLSVPTMNWPEMQRRASKSYRGDVTMNSRTYLRGITTIDGDLRLDGWVQGGGLVIVHGDVYITKRGAGAADGLLIWADGDVRIPESNTQVTAGIITSRDISVSGSNVRIIGNLVGRDISIKGSNVTITASSAAFRFFPR